MATLETLGETIKNIDEQTTMKIMEFVKKEIDKSISEFPFTKTYISTLGGEVNASLLVTVGIDKKEDWAHGIFENSRFVRYHIDRTRKGIEIECFQFHLRNKELKKFRKMNGTIEKVLIRFGKDLKVLESL